MTKPLMLIACIAVVGAACGAPADDLNRANPATIERINAHTDCADLLAEFNQFVAVHDSAEPRSSRRVTALAYMNATGDRAADLDCPWY